MVEPAWLPMLIIRAPVAVARSAASAGGPKIQSSTTSKPSPAACFRAASSSPLTQLDNIVGDPSLLKALQPGQSPRRTNYPTSAHGTAQLKCNLTKRPGCSKDQDVFSGLNMRHVERSQRAGPAMPK